MLQLSLYTAAPKRSPLGGFFCFNEVFHSDPYPSKLKTGAKIMDQGVSSRYSSALLQRLRASAIHLVASLMAAGIASWLVFFCWFPYPYRIISGGQDLFLLLIGVDVVLGPCLTFVVFNTKKPRFELVRDIALISLVQLSALVYGVLSVYQSRPIYLVHEVDRFVAVTAADIEPNDLTKAQPAFQKLPFMGVQLLGLSEATLDEDRLESLQLAMAGKDKSLRPQFWQALSDSNLQTIRKRARPLKDLSRRSSADEAVINAWLDKEKRSMHSLVYLPLTARKSVWTVVMGADNLEIVGYLPLDSF